MGVVSALQGRELRLGTPEFGQGVEPYLMHELSSHADYRPQDSLSFWRSTSGFEVDFIIDDHTAVKVKVKANVSAQDLKPLRALAGEKVPANRISEILKRRRAVTGDTALRLAHIFGTSAEFRLNLQKLYELRLAEEKAGKAIKALPTLRSEHVRW